MFNLKSPSILSVFYFIFCSYSIPALSPVDLVHYEIKAFDILINEIMADPLPSFGLPEFEYIELYNRSDQNINLQEWTVSVGNKKFTFPSWLMEAGDYLIVCSSEILEKFQKFGSCFAFENFGSLYNSGQTVTLHNSANDVISSVSYTNKWYKNEYKAQGGWALEQIDPDNPCGGKENWESSCDPIGGSPGLINSIFRKNPDYIRPNLEKIIVLSSSSIKLFFSEPYDRIPALDPKTYYVDKGILYPIFIDLSVPDYTSLALTFEKVFKENTIYTLSLDNNFSDCVGNPVSNLNTGRFSIPKSANKLDVVINEVLFDPLYDGVDYVEIYNRSDKTLDLKDLLISSKDETTGELKSIYEISNEGHLLFPEDYLVLTTNIAKVKEQYYSTNPLGFNELAKMPSLGNNYGQIVLLDKRLNIIDHFYYNKNMHFDLLNDFAGVSLERINFNLPTNDLSNWHSAAETYGFGTPAYQNSQYRSDPVITKFIQIEPEIFSPDNDGKDDIVLINYAFKNPGNVGSIIIFDSKGRIIKLIANNELLAIKGSFSWNGLNESGKKARIGIYLIYIEIFNLSGQFERYKEICVLAGRIL